ncbi:unnamed protein product [Discosporangium mesarthrocarpum]
MVTEMVLVYRLLFLQSRGGIWSRALLVSMLIGRASAICLTQVLRMAPPTPPRMTSCMAMHATAETYSRPILKRCIQEAPAGPGVYIMETIEGQKLYIGKSVDLSSRVPSYFRISGKDAEFSLLPAASVSHRIAAMTNLVHR